jgi:hypothetical protein
MKNYFKQLSILSAAVMGIALASSVMATEIASGASRTSDAEYRQALSTAKTGYDTAYGSCSALLEHDRRECRRQAHQSWENAKETARAEHGVDWPKGPEFQ